MYIITLSQKWVLWVAVMVRVRLPEIHASLCNVCVCACITDRLVLGVADTSDEQVDQLGAQYQTVEGERSEALLHGPLLTGRLIWVQVGVGSIPAHGQQQYKYQIWAITLMLGNGHIQLDIASIV